MTQSFSRARRERARRQGARQPGHHDAVRDPGARPAATPSPGVDILAASPTGSGKTLAFGIPMIERTAGAGGQPSALVLVPTRELASQVVADLRPLAAARKPADRRRLRRNVARRPGQAGPRRPDPRRDARAA